MCLRNITRLSYLGACLGSGQPINGVQHGPKAVRQSGLFKTLHENYNIQVNDHGDVTEHKNNTQYKSHINNLNILDPSLEQLNNRVQKTISKINDKEQIFLTVGGDHSIATGTIHGLMGKYPDLKVIWVDAHGDLIDAGKSTYPGYHGMPLSHLIGANDKNIPGFKWLTRRLNPKNIVHIGGRDIDTDQWQTIKSHKIKFFTPDHIDMFGIGQVMKQTLAYLNPNSPIHISFDIDAMQPYLAESTGTKYRGGLTYREGVHIIRRACHEAYVVSMDLVEINPMIKDQVKRNHYRGEEHYQDGINNTVAMGGALVESLFKKYMTL